MYDYPLLPICLYDENNPPFIPNINIPQELMRILPVVTGSTINEAGKKANEAKHRMFCYNVLSSNNWQNNNFYEVVKLVCDNIYMLYKKGVYRTPEFGIQDAVQRILTLYSSDLIFRDNNLKNMCSPEILNAASQNTQVFNQLKQELLVFQPTWQQQQPNMQQFPNQNMGGYAHPSMYPQGNMMQPNPQMGMQWPQANMQQPMPNPGFYNPPQMVNPGFINNQPTQNFRTYHNANEPQNIPEQSIKQSEYFTPSPNNSGVSLPTNIVVNNTIEEGNEMNREQHTINAFDGLYTLDSSRYAKLTDSTKVLTNPYPEENNVYMYDSTLFEVNLDTAINTGKIKQIQTQGKEYNTKVFRVFTIIGNPFISYYDFSKYMSTLKKADSFNTLATTLKKLVATLENLSEQKKYTDAVVTFFSHYDNVLTDLVNDFLKNKIRTDVTIESFTTDIAELYSYIYKKHGNNYKESFAKFEDETIESLFEDINKTLSDSIKESMGLETTSTEFIEFVPLSYSITYTFLINKELKYNDKLPFMIIEEETSPSLYRIASSLKISKRLKDQNTNYDILVTADGIKYKLHSSVSDNKKYFLTKM